MGCVRQRNGSAIPRGAKRVYRQTPMETFFGQRTVRVFRRTMIGALGVLALASTSAIAMTRGELRQVAVLRGYAVEPLANDTLRPAERAFLEKALATARLQARMAELGAAQATNTEVRSHAEQLKSDARQMGEAITGLIQKRAAATPGTAAAEPASESYTQLAARTGADFDREFVRVMAELHDDTIGLFEQAAADAKDADVRELAAAQLPMLRAHRGRIVELKKTFD